MGKFCLLLHIFCVSLAFAGLSPSGVRALSAMACCVVKATCEARGRRPHDTIRVIRHYSWYTDLSPSSCCFLLVLACSYCYLLLLLLLGLSDFYLLLLAFACFCCFLLAFVCFWFLGPQSARISLGIFLCFPFHS